MDGPDEPSRHPSPPCEGGRAKLTRPASSFGLFSGMVASESSAHWVPRSALSGALVRLSLDPIELGQRDSVLREAGQALIFTQRKVW